MRKSFVIEKDADKYPIELDKILNTENVVGHSITPIPSADATMIKTIVVINVEKPTKIKQAAPVLKKITG